MHRASITVSLREACANNYIDRPPYLTVARAYVNRGWLILLITFHSTYSTNLGGLSVDCNVTSTMSWHCMYHSLYTYTLTIYMEYYLPYYSIDSTTCIIILYCSTLWPALCIHLYVQLLLITCTQLNNKLPRDATVDSYILAFKVRLELFFRVWRSGSSNISFSCHALLKTAEKGYTVCEEPFASCII